MAKKERRKRADVSFRKPRIASKILTKRKIGKVDRKFKRQFSLSPFLIPLTNRKTRKASFCIRKPPDSPVVPERFTGEQNYLRVVE